MTDASYSVIVALASLLDDYREKHIDERDIDRAAPDHVPGDTLYLSQHFGREDGCMTYGQLRKLVDTALATPSPSELGEAADHVRAFHPCECAVCKAYDAVRARSGE